MVALQMSLLWMAVHCLVLVMVQPVFSQTVIDNGVCQDLGKHCGNVNGPNSEKYCCVEGQGTIFKCCNPYTGLIVGLSVGIPLVVLAIVAVVILYCCCASYHNRKMAQLASTYASNRESRRNTAPPPYTMMDLAKGDSELPSYSEADPYQSTQVPGNSTNNANDLQVNTTVAASDLQVNTTVASSDLQVNVTAEDAPLLSDED